MAQFQFDVFAMFIDGEMVSSIPVADASEPVVMPVPKKAERHSVRVLIGKYRRGKEHTSNNEGISHS